MEDKKTEVRIKLSTKEKCFLGDKSILIDYVVKKIKEFEEGGEYKCTLLEIEI